MDEEELLLHGDDASLVNTDNIDEDLLLNESINGDAGSVTGEGARPISKLESVDHEELDYEEDEEKEERESKFTSERSKKSPIRGPDDDGKPATTTSENTATATRGSYRGGRGGFRGGGRGGTFNTRGGMRMVGGGGFVAGPISLLTSNIPPPMMMNGPGMGGPVGKILVNPNFGAGLTLLPTPGGYGAPPMGGPLRGPAQMMPMPTVPKVTLSIDGVPAVPPSAARQMAPMGMGAGAPMSMPPPQQQQIGGIRPGGLAPLIINQMVAPPPSAMRFPPGMGPPPMTMPAGMSVPPPGMAPLMAGGGVMGAPGAALGVGGQPPQGANWNLMVEAFLGDKKSGEKSKKSKKRRRSRSSSYSSYSDSESDYSTSSRSRSRSRSPRRSRKRDSRRHRSSKHGKERGGKGGERRVFRTGPNSFRINSAPGNGSELPSLLEGMEHRESSKGQRGGGDSNGGGSRSSRRADRERQREVRETAVENRLRAFREAEAGNNNSTVLVVPPPPTTQTQTQPQNHLPPPLLGPQSAMPPPTMAPNQTQAVSLLGPPQHHLPVAQQPLQQLGNPYQPHGGPPPPNVMPIQGAFQHPMPSYNNQPPMQPLMQQQKQPPMLMPQPPMTMQPPPMNMQSYPNYNGPAPGVPPHHMNSRPASLLNLRFTN